MVKHSKQVEDQTDHQHHHDEQHIRKDTSNSSLTLVSSMMGASLLSIAFIIHKLGWVLSMLAILVTLVWSYIVYYYYVEATHYTNSVSYPELAQKLFNRKISILLNICIIVSNYGFCTGYIIISSRQILMFIQTVMKDPSFGTGSTKYIPYVIKAVVAMGVTWPLCCIRKLSILGKIASVSGLFLLITTITILVYFGINAKKGYWCYGGGANGGYIQYSLPAFPPPKDGKPINTLYRVLYFFMYIPSLQGNFSVQTVIPSLLHDLQGPRVIKKKITYISVCVAVTTSLLFYCIVGYFGAAMFGDETADNILAAFSPCQELWPAICGLLYALVVIIVYPLIVFPNKVAILQICNLDYDTDKGYKYSLIVSFLFPALTMTLGMVLEQIVTIFGFFSAISGILYYFIVPVSCALKMKKLRFLNPDADKMEEGDVTVDPVLVGVMSMFGSIVNRQSISKARAMSIKMFPEKPITDDDFEVVPAENISPANLGSQLQRRASVSKKQRTVSLLRPRTFSIQKIAEDHYKIRTNSAVRRKSSVNSAMSASFSSKNNPRLASQEQNLIDENEEIEKVAEEKSKFVETTSATGSSQKQDKQEQPEPQKDIIQQGYNEQIKALEAVNEVDGEEQNKPSRFQAQHTVAHDDIDEETTVEEIQLNTSKDGSTISKTRMAVCISIMVITTAICIEGIYMNGVDVIQSFS